jgi:hypothetical protein
VSAKVFEDAAARRVETGAHGQEWEVQRQLRPNPVWRLGRLFLCCPRCSRHCARLYMPVGHLRPECRRCWGLTYDSRRANYRRALTGFLGEQGISSSAWERSATLERRRAQRASSAARQDARHHLLRGVIVASD